MKQVESLEEMAVMEHSIPLSQMHFLGFNPEIHNPEDVSRCGSQLVGYTNLDAESKFSFYIQMEMRRIYLTDSLHLWSQEIDTTPVVKYKVPKFSKDVSLRCSRAFRELGVRCTPNDFLNYQLLVYRRNSPLVKGFFQYGQKCRDMPTAVEIVVNKLGCLELREYSVDILDGNLIHYRSREIGNLCYNGRIVTQVDDLYNLPVIQELTTIGYKVIFGRTSVLDQDGASTLIIRVIREDTNDGDHTNIDDVTNNKSNAKEIRK